MARRDAQRLTRRLKDAGAIATTALKQLEGVLDEIGDHDLSPADMTTVQRQLDTQIEAIGQQFQQLRAATGSLGTRAAIGPEAQPRAGRRTAGARGRLPGAGGGVPPRIEKSARPGHGGRGPQDRGEGAAGGIPGRG